MAKRVVLVQGHPDPAGGKYCHALADAYVRGAQLVGSSVDVIEVTNLDFPLLKTKEEFHSGVDGTPPSLVAARDAIVAADHLVLVYPLWHGTMPAILKGFLEQILRPGVGLEYGGGGFPRKLLKGKSARIVVTMGMPAAAYRWYFGAHSLKNLHRNILGFCGINPIRDSLYGMVESVSDEKRRAWLKKLTQTASRDCR